MSIFRTLHRSLLSLFVIVVVSIVMLTHFSISKIVAEQARLQQQSISPALSLIVQELMRPLHVAQTLAEAVELKSLMGAEQIDEEQVFSMLKRLEQEFGMAFFIASEKSRMQYLSNGERIELTPETVEWYFQFKETQADAIADTGKWEDPHFYIDLKIYDDQSEFLGFFGTGKSLQDFISLFDTYKQMYGYDFLFVDQNQIVTLSSDASLVAAHVDYIHLQELSWYQQLDEDVKQRHSLNNQLVKIDGQDHLIAEVNIAPFDWTMYLLSPLQSRQMEISRGFILSIVSLLVVIFGLFFLVNHLLYYYRKDMQRKVQTDYLTQLANREKIEERYQELISGQHEVSLLLLDFDHFKQINDTYGHNAGDKVLQQVSAMLATELGPEDLLGRWGGEEFIVLLPHTELEQAEQLANQLRFKIATLIVYYETHKIQLTASIGIAHTTGDPSLTELISWADEALYRAKQSGRNRIESKAVNE